MKRTPPLKGMSHIAAPQGGRRRLRSADAERGQGRTIILVDDVLTTGSTAEPAPGRLRRAGASRVELICWAQGGAPGAAHALGHGRDCMEEGRLPKVEIYTKMTCGFCIRAKRCSR